VKQTESQILNRAREYIGVKFFYKGRGRGGIDCAGICLKALDLDDNLLDYKQKNSMSKVEEEVSKLGYKVMELKPADIIVFKDGHLAIYTDKDTIIHSYYKTGRVIEETLTKTLKEKIYSIYRSI
jgi:cell wall-associated NlpC family hydrolase